LNIGGIDQVSTGVLISCQCLAFSKIALVLLVPERSALPSGTTLASMEIVMQFSKNQLLISTFKTMLTRELLQENGLTNLEIGNLPKSSTSKIYLP